MFFPLHSSYASGPCDEGRRMFCWFANAMMKFANAQHLRCVCAVAGVTISDGSFTRARTQAAAAATFNGRQGRGGCATRGMHGTAACLCRRSVPALNAQSEGV